MPLIEKRYAEALIGLSVKEDAIDDYQKELLVIIDIYENHQDLRQFLLNPEVKTNIKKKVVSNSFNGSIRKELVNFLSLLLDKGRIKHLPGILAEFSKAADSLKNTIDITVISAVTLEKEQINRIVEKYKTLYGSKNAKLHTEIDKNIIGGIKVKIGDKVVDGTITGRLQSLREILIES